MRWRRSRLPPVPPFPSSTSAHYDYALTARRHDIRPAWPTGDASQRCGVRPRRRPGFSGLNFHASFCAPVGGKAEFGGKLRHGRGSCGSIGRVENGLDQRGADDRAVGEAGHLGSLRSAQRRCDRSTITTSVGRSAKGCVRPHVGGYARRDHDVCRQHARPSACLCIPGDVENVRYCRISGARFSLMQSSPRLGAASTSTSGSGQRRPQGNQPCRTLQRLTQRLIIGTSH